MGACQTSQKPRSRTEARKQSELKTISSLTKEIESLKEKLLFAQALLKMGILQRLLRNMLQEEVNKERMEQIMQLQIEMGRINQDIMCNHVKATMCLESALRYSNLIYGIENSVANRFILPLLNVSKSVLDEASSSLKPKISVQSTFQVSQSDLTVPQSSSPRKFIQRSSTHATTRVSCVPHSLNIIMEESREYYEDGMKWRESNNNDRLDISQQNQI